MIDRCYIDRETGFLIPGCYGGLRGASRCVCEPRPRGVEAMARRELAEDRKREASRAAAIAAEDARNRAAAAAREAAAARRCEAKAEAAAAWKAAGGVPRVLAGGRT